MHYKLRRDAVELRTIDGAIAGQKFPSGFAVYIQEKKLLIRLEEYPRVGFVPFFDIGEKAIAAYELIKGVGESSIDVPSGIVNHGIRTCRFQGDLESITRLAKATALRNDYSGGVKLEGSIAYDNVYPRPPKGIVSAFFFDGVALLFEPMSNGLAPHGEVGRNAQPMYQQAVSAMERPVEREGEISERIIDFARDHNRMTKGLKKLYEFFIPLIKESKRNEQTFWGTISPPAR